MGVKTRARTYLTGSTGGETSETAEETLPAALLDPHHFDSDPEDEAAGGTTMSGQEWEYRNGNRRPEFRALLDELKERFDLDTDIYEWAIDESWHAYFIPVSQADAAADLIAERGFEVELSENIYEKQWGEEDGTNLWVQDPVVAKLLPEDYNWFTERHPEAVAERTAAAEPAPEPVDLTAMLHGHSGINPAKWDKPTRRFHDRYAVAVMAEHGLDPREFDEWEGFRDELLEASAEFLENAGIDPFSQGWAADYNAIAEKLWMDAHRRWSTGH